MEQLSMDDILKYIEELRFLNEVLAKNQVESNQKIQDLINYNTKLPHDINKYFKMLKNHLDDLQDQVDRIEELIDVKITNKKEMVKLRSRVKDIEDDLTTIKSKCLDIDNHFIMVEKSMFKNRTQCDNQHQDLHTIIEHIKKPENKKLQSDINNTKYSIKKLTIKQNNGTITEKESKRLEFKQKLLEELIKNDKFL